MSTKEQILWSIRMRASKGGLHISGAEGIYPGSDIDKTVAKYFRRAIGHPKGRADSILVTVERLREKPSKISTLPVSTIECESPREAKFRIEELLRSAGVSEAAIKSYPAIMKKSLRGAAFLSASTGERLDPDAERGIRVSRLGIDAAALKALKRKLARAGINTQTVIEALILASKVAASGRVAAELCISDNPDYTTGYVASRRFGYVRITNIKSPRGGGAFCGGRVFYVEDGVDVESLIDYLQMKPVIVTEVDAVA